MARLDRLCSDDDDDDDDDAICDESEQERRAKLFGWDGRNQFQLTLTLTPS